MESSLIGCSDRGGPLSPEVLHLDRFCCRPSRLHPCGGPCDRAEGSFFGAHLPSAPAWRVPGERVRGWGGFPCTAWDGGGGDASPYNGSQGFYLRYLLHPVRWDGGQGISRDRLFWFLDRKSV